MDAVAAGISAERRVGMAVGKMNLTILKWRNKTIKELTRIITAQITLIEQMPEEDADTIIASKEEEQENVKAELQNLYGADDVTVSIQDFVRDK